jgi:hypothetical protein
MNSLEEAFQLPAIQASFRPHAAAHIQSIGLYLPDSVRNVLRLEAARQKDGNGDRPAYLPADLPVVDAARSAQLFDGKVAVSG